SQRSLLAIEIKDPAALAASLERSMKGDPKVRLLKIGEHDVWEILNEEDAELDLELKEPGAADDEDTPDRAAAEGGAPPASSAVTVAQGHLFVASHIDLLEKVLAQAQAEEP